LLSIAFQHPKGTWQESESIHFKHSGYCNTGNESGVKLLSAGGAPAGGPNQRSREDTPM
jgi:hypothetical protein